jgi:3-hydroxymyristoyl/3-hydroxydecanoyl-(acyl carrier protein) dehydratase
MDGLVDLLPHRPPWLLVDRVIVREATRVECAKQLAGTDPLLFSAELPEVLIIEALAQAAACLNAGELGQHRGLLVAAVGFEFHGRARAGETLRLVAVKEAALGGLVRFLGEAFMGEHLLARGHLTFAVEEKP